MSLVSMLLSETYLADHVRFLEPSSRPEMYEHSAEKRKWKSKVNPVSLYGDGIHDRVEFLDTSQQRQDDQ